MTIATQIAALLDPRLGRPGRQSMSAIPGPAPVAGSEDRAIGPASHLLLLLTSLTEDEIDVLAPVDRRLLVGQLERVHRMVADASLMGEAPLPAGNGLKCSKAASLDDRRDGRERE